MDWSKTQHDRCVALAREKKSAADIARMMSEEFGETVSRSAILGRMGRHQISVGTPKKAKVGKVRKERDLAKKLQGNAPLRVLRHLAPPVIAEVPLPKTPAPEGFLGLSLMELKQDDCRYPYGDGPFFFCGQPQERGSSYCPTCKKVCENQNYQITPEERAKRSERAIKMNAQRKARAA